MGLKKNLDLVLYDKIKDRLISGSYLPGQKIYIDEVADHYGGSRTPVVPAVKRLENEKILIAASNGRVMVPEYTEKEILDICRARLLIEGFAIDTICEQHNGTVLDRLRTLAGEFEQCDMKDEYVKSCKADLALHKALVAGAGNHLIDDLYSVVQGRFLVVSYLSITVKLRNQERTVQQHSDLLDSLDAFDAKRSIEILREHIMDISGQILEIHGHELTAQETI